MTTLTTERLLLRPWKQSDFEPFAALNADPRVMEFFASPPAKYESDKLATHILQGIEAKGWGLWAVEVLGGAPFIGFIGLNQVTFPAPFTPAVEIGWRLAYDFWGKGYAPEGARACLDCAFGPLDLEEIVAFTATNNKRSQRVMDKLGMHRDLEGDFDHPNVMFGHPLARQVLYRISALEWPLTAG